MVSRGVALHLPGDDLTCSERVVKRPASKYKRWLVMVEGGSIIAGGIVV